MEAACHCLTAYTNFPPLREDFFAHRLVRITQRAELNDPYEFHPSSADIADFRRLMPQESIGSYGISDKFIIDNHFNCVGVISFTEAVDNFLMWSHYADAHRGMAIEFDPRHAFFCDLQKVNYSDRRAPDPSIMHDGTNAYVRNVNFLEKSTQWEYEKEWRIIDSLVGSDCRIHRESEEKEWSPERVNLFPWEKPGIYMRQIPAEAIISVTFGCRVDEQKISMISALIAYHSELAHVKKYRLELKYDEYKLQFVEV